MNKKDYSPIYYWNIFICLVVYVLNLSLSFSQTSLNKSRDSDALDKSFHQQKREALRKLLPPSSAAVFFSNPQRNRSNDVDYDYHQDPDFFYLTGLKEPNAVLLIYSEKYKINDCENNEFLFLQNRNPHIEKWVGNRLGQEGAKKELGFLCVFPNTQFSKLDLKFDSLKRVFIKDIFHGIVDDENENGDLYELVQEFKNKVSFPLNYKPVPSEIYEMIKSTPYNLKTNVATILEKKLKTQHYLMRDTIILNFLESKNEKEYEESRSKIKPQKLDGFYLSECMSFLRQKKSEDEIKLLKKAIKISCIAQVEVMKAMEPGMSEREVQGIHEFVYKKYDAECIGYPSIIGTGGNGCILHYSENSKLSQPNDLILMDAGAEYRGYTADVTRTIPVNGKFSDEQKIIYSIVLKAQKAGIEQCRTGKVFRAPHNAATDVIAQELIKISLIKDKSEVYKYFPHGTSHYLGLDVHDPGLYAELEAGMIITVEPGIYIPEGSKCDKKWWNIGVRIEDDILITKDEPVNLSESAPREIQEIEELMKQKSVLNEWTLPMLE